MAGFPRKKRRKIKRMSEENNSETTGEGLALEGTTKPTKNRKFKKNLSVKRHGRQVAQESASQLPLSRICTCPSCGKSEKQSRAMIATYRSRDGQVSGQKSEFVVK